MHCSENACLIICNPPFSWCLLYWCLLLYQSNTAVHSHQETLTKVWIVPFAEPQQQHWNVQQQNRFTGVWKSFNLHLNKHSVNFILNHLCCLFWNPLSFVTERVPEQGRQLGSPVHPRPHRQIFRRRLPPGARWASSDFHSPRWLFLF